MYNLIMGAVDGTLGADRMLEVVDPALEAFIGTRNQFDGYRLMELPTLLMPELQDASNPQVARVGNIVSITRAGLDYRFKFVPNPHIPEISSSRIEAVAIDLGISRWDFTRTRWSVKQGDLYQVIFERNLIGIPRPTAFVLPSSPPAENRVAVMMPFSGAFDPVWNSLRSAVQSRGWLCQRADDIWDNSVLVHDVVALIAQSKVVICDLTGRNANVFYEAGIAHTLGREVVLIAQSDNDVPFDLGHHRYIKYLPNSEGLATMETKLVSRLQTLMAR